MDIENGNCRLHVSQCTDLDITYIERPIKIDREITGLEKLLEELHSVFSSDHVDIQDVQKLMACYKSDPKDWRKYAKFDRFKYTRNLVDEGNGLFNVMILCWGPAHASAIHDHADSHCFMKLLSGSLEEVRYDWPKHVEPEVVTKLKNKNMPRCCATYEDYKKNNHNSESDCHDQSCHNFGGKMEKLKENGDASENMIETGRTKLDVDDVCYINDAIGLHRMENPSNVDGAVSLHLYCPPFNSCRVFDARTGHPTNVNVTFWSKHGKKIKRVIEANSIADTQN